MELINKKKMTRLFFVLFTLCLLTSCSKDSEATTNYSYYYPVEAGEITAKQIGDGSGTFDPKGIVISKEKLYVCNGDVLEIFNALTLEHIKTVTHYVEENTSIPFSRLTSITVHNGRIYLGSVNSRLFVLDETTTKGISVMGNGQWWMTFVHVFGVAVGDDLVFVKEKANSIKVFEIEQITKTSEWNLKPIAKLNTLAGFTEIYSMEVIAGKLVVAGRDAKSYLYYDIANIKANAEKSLITPIKPVTAPFTEVKPISVSFGTDFVVTSELSGGKNFIRLYTKGEFLSKTYAPALNASDVLGKNPFGNIVNAVMFNDRIFLSDRSNKKIRVLKLVEAGIVEH